MAFLCDNTSAFISDASGNIKMIKWQTGVNSSIEISYIEESKKLYDNTSSMCLSKDEKYLLFGSNNILCVFETETREVTKEFKLAGFVQAISLMQDGKIAIIGEGNSDLSILDLETLKIRKIAKNITKGKELTGIAII